MINQRLCLAETTTGLVVGDLPTPTQPPTWSRTLNGAGSLSAVVPLKPPLDLDMRDRLEEPWRWTLIWSIGGWIAQAGMLVKVDPSEGEPATVTLTTKTMWDFLASKTVLFNPGNAIDTPAADVLFGPTSPDPKNQNLSLHSIARRIVEIGLQSVTLPMILPDPISGTAQRSYAAADLAAIGQRVAELTAVLSGPEVELSPEWTDSDQSHFTTRLRIGNPRLGQLGFPHAWDLGQAWESVDLSLDGTDMTFYSIAKGQDTRQAADPKNNVKPSGKLYWSTSSFVSNYVAAGWPFMVTADTTHSDVQDNALLGRYADQNVTTNQRPVYTATGEFRIDGHNSKGQDTSSPSIDLVSTGDTGLLGVGKHHWLDPGQYGIRLLQLEGAAIRSAKATVQWLGT